MEERHIVAPRTWPRLLVDELDVVLATDRQCAFDVRRLQCDVVDSGPGLIQVARNRALLQWLEEFDVAVPTQVEEDDLEAVEFLLMGDGRPEQRFVGLCNCCGVVCGDTDMVELHTRCVARLAQYLCGHRPTIWGYSSIAEVTHDIAMSERVACNAWDNSECQGMPYCPPRCPRFVDEEGILLLARPYRETDVAALEAMYDIVARQGRTTMGLPPERPDHRWRWLDGFTANESNLAALDDDSVVGHVAVAPLAAKEPDLMVFVCREYRGRDVETELLEPLVLYSATSKYDALSLDVMADNERALSIYRQ